MDESQIRGLEDIWPLQAALNRRAGFDTAALGEAMAAAEADGTLPSEGGLRCQVGRAMKNYLDALASECHELHDCLSWKHWYREAKAGRQYELRDIQNARVEATDNTPHTNRRTVRCCERRGIVGGQWRDGSTSLANIDTYTLNSEGQCF